LVVSEPICKGLDLAVLKELRNSVVVSLNGSIVSKSCEGDSITDPLNSLVALYQHAAEYNITLKSGDIVSTGAMCVPFNIEGSGHKVVADFLNMQLGFIL
jgi:2-keto-4-pentenoate hydratase